MADNRCVDTSVSFCIPYPKIRHWNRYFSRLYILCLMFGIGMTPLVYDLSVWNSLYSVQAARVNRFTFCLTYIAE